MTTRECYQWIQRRRKLYEPADIPDMPLPELLRAEERRRERLSLQLIEQIPVPDAATLAEPIDRYLMHTRLSFSESLVLTMLAPWSPCRVRDWTRGQRLWWLLSVTWDLVGVEQWRQRERWRYRASHDAWAE